MSYNLLDEHWIPVAGHEPVSLQAIFSDESLRHLGGNPVEKISVMNLLLAISQAACTPDNEEEWRQLGADLKKFGERCLSYLRSRRDLFELYGDKPFLQFPAIKLKISEPQKIGGLYPHIATGNTTVLTQRQLDHSFTDAEKAVALLVQMNFSLGGKRTDNSFSLSAGYSLKKTSAKPGSGVGYNGFLHTYCFGKSILETIWMNTFTEEEIEDSNLFPSGIGMPPWDDMPKGEDDEIAQDLKESLEGQLLSMNRFCLLDNNGIYITEGIVLNDGSVDPSTLLKKNKKNVFRCEEVHPEKRPWRDLVALTSCLDSQSDNNSICWRLNLALSKLAYARESVGIWSGGLQVTFSMGTQKVSSTNDYVESAVEIYPHERWFRTYKTEFAYLEEMDRTLQRSVREYVMPYGSSSGAGNLADASKLAGRASLLFWERCDPLKQRIINLCRNNESPKLRSRIDDIVLDIFNIVCPKTSSRQLLDWARAYPSVGRARWAQSRSPKMEVFISRILQIIKQSKGDAAALRRAFNPATQYEAWPILIPILTQEKVDLKSDEKDAYFLVAAALAQSKVETDGNQDLGKALAVCFANSGNGGESSHSPGAQRLQRLLSCDSLSEACRVLRPMLHLIQSQGNAHLSYSQLLEDLRDFRFDTGRDRVKMQWAISFYGRSVDSSNEEAV